MYKELINIIINSLKFLKESIFGKFSMSSEMKRMLTELQNNEIPSVWAAFSYPSSVSLSLYVFNLNQR